jgi:hypothetical protein
MVEHCFLSPSPPWAGRDGEGRSGTQGWRRSARERQSTSPLSGPNHTYELTLAAPMTGHCATYQFCLWGGATRLARKMAPTSVPQRVGCPKLQQRAAPKLATLWGRDCRITDVGGSCPAWALQDHLHEPRLSSRARRLQYRGLVHLGAACRNFAQKSALFATGM